MQLIPRDRAHTPTPLRASVAVALLTVALSLGACAGPAATSSAPGPTETPTDLVASPSTQPSVAAATPTPSAAVTAASPTAPSLAPLTLLWEKAGPAKVKTEPYWPTINPITGHVWVSDPWNNEYWIFNPDGKFLEAWGTAGSGPGQFNLTTHDPNPDGVGAIAFAPDGSFYIADNGNYRVEKFDKNRGFVTAWGKFGTGDGQFASPKGIATDGHTVWVADDPRGDIQAFDTNGKFLRSFPFPFVLFSLTPAGNLIGGDQTGVLELDKQGSQVAHFDLDYAALGGNQVVVDKSGDIFVPLQADSGPIGLVELDPHGAIVHRWTTGAETMTLSPDGTAAYLAYTAASRSGWPFIRKYAIPRS